QPELARTLQAIADQGADALYGGELGRCIIAHIGKLGGCLTLDDLTAVKPVWRRTIAVNYRDLEVHTPPPPCEGFQFLLTLRILQGLELEKQQRNGVEHLDSVWRAIRLAAGVRIHNNNPTPEKLAQLLSDQHVTALRQRIADGLPIEGP